MSGPEKIDEVFKRLSWYAVPVCTLGNFRVDWRVVIAESEAHARGGVEDEIDKNEQHHLFVSSTYMTRWLAPAHEQDIEAMSTKIVDSNGETCTDCKHYVAHHYVETDGCSVRRPIGVDKFEHCPCTKDHGRTL